MVGSLWEMRIRTTVELVQAPYTGEATKQTGGDRYCRGTEFIVQPENERQANRTGEQGAFASLPQRRDCVVRCPDARNRPLRLLRDWQSRSEALPGRALCNVDK